MRHHRLRVEAEFLRHEASIARMWATDPSQREPYRSLYAQAAEAREAQAAHVDAEAARWSVGWRRWVP